MRRQTYAKIQWIIMDGGSSDETVQLLRANEDIIDIWFSETDLGIYDAWNKALDHVSGNWVQFLGAGDEFAGDEVLTNVARCLSRLSRETDVAYGRVVLISESARKEICYLGGSIDPLVTEWKGWLPNLPPHPAVFHRSGVFATLRFDLRFKIAADNHLLLLLLRQRRFHYIDIVVDKMVIGGVSTRPDTLRQTMREFREVAKDLDLRVPTIHSAYEYLKLTVKLTLIRILPSRIQAIVFDWFRRVMGKDIRWTVK